MPDPTRAPQPSRSKTGKVLSPAEHQQRVDAAQAAARRRQRSMDRAYARAAQSGRGQGRPQWDGTPTKMTAGVGNPNAAGYQSTDAMRSAFQSAGVSGADINQSKDPRSGFLSFSGKDPAVHRKFVDALKSQGFRVAQRADGSGYAVNAAGQGVRLGKPSNRTAPTPPRKIVKVDQDTGQITTENPVRRVSSRSLHFP